MFDPIFMLDTVEMKDAAKQRMSDFNVQDLANTAWAFATVGQLDATMVRVMSWEVFECIRRYEATDHM